MFFIFSPLHIYDTSYFSKLTHSLFFMSIACLILPVCCILCSWYLSFFLFFMYITFLVLLIYMLLSLHMCCMSYCSHLLYLLVYRTTYSSRLLYSPFLVSIVFSFLHVYRISCSSHLVCLLVFTCIACPIVHIYYTFLSIARLVLPVYVFSILGIYRFLHVYHISCSSPLLCFLVFTCIACPIVHIYYTFLSIARLILPVYCIPYFQIYHSL